MLVSAWLNYFCSSQSWLATAQQLCCACADRLLLQRLRKSQSGTALYKEAQVAEEQQERLLSQQNESEGSQRLLVVANRLPVSAYRDKDGRWQLQVEHLPDEEVVCAHCRLAIALNCSPHALTSLPSMRPMQVATLGCVNGVKHIAASYLIVLHVINTDTQL